MTLYSGTNHSCVGGGLPTLCWGSNASGQLGVALSPRSVPVPVGLPAGMVLSSDILLGTSHSCGREIPAFLLACWGSNASGELGDGTTTSREVPRTVNLPGRPSSVALGNAFTCALVMRTDSLSTIVSGQDIYCWGRNDRGQLGDGTTFDRSSPTRASLRVTDRAVMYAGNAHACVVSGDDYVAAGSSTYCWGANESGQLGDGSTTSRSIPTLVGTRIPFVSMLLGGAHSCGRDRSSWYCWGSNTYGQLGNGSFGSGVLVPQHVTHGVAITAAGGNHTCGVASNRLFCWGLNSSGQLGDGTTIDRAVPTPVADYRP